MNERDPCPYRILDDIGGAFVMGSVGGGLFHLIRGFRNSPRGERMLGMRMAVKARAPVLGGNFAVWGGLFSCFDCTLAYMRRKEDPWNSIIAGAVTGGVLAARGGRRAIITNTVVGGAILALIEGLGIMITNYVSSAPPASFDQYAPPQEHAAPPPITDYYDDGTHSGRKELLRGGVDPSLLQFSSPQTSDDLGSFGSDNINNSQSKTTRKSWM